MTKLLVSVRSAAEARVAVECGADLVDVKEPSRGSLGAASEQEASAVADAVDGRRPLSVALGELDEADAARFARLDHRYQFAKLGLVGCAANDDWAHRWKEALSALPASVTRVAVVYADWRAAFAPSPEDVLNYGVQLACRVVLIDTFNKARGGLFDCWTMGELTSFAHLVHSRGVALALAGSITRRDIQSVVHLRPWCLAVRGAVTAGDRSGPIDGALVAELAEMLRAVE